MTRFHDLIQNCLKIYFFVPKVMHFFHCVASTASLEGRKKKSQKKLRSECFFLLTCYHFNSLVRIRVGNILLIFVLFCTHCITIFTRTQHFSRKQPLKQKKKKKKSWQVFPLKTTENFQSSVGVWIFDASCNQALPIAKYNEIWIKIDLKRSEEDKKDSEALKRHRVICHLHLSGYLFSCRLCS